MFNCKSSCLLSQHIYAHLSSSYLYSLSFSFALLLQQRWLSTASIKIPKALEGLWAANCSILLISDTRSSNHNRFAAMPELTPYILALELHPTRSKTICERKHKVEQFGMKKKQNRSQQQRTERVKLTKYLRWCDYHKWAWSLICLEAKRFRLEVLVWGTLNFSGKLL